LLPIGTLSPESTAISSAINQGGGFLLCYLFIFELRID
jgi:hypothetical protein